ncbi:hypothetical protein Ciccas_003623 [Cichlidogyrus casuarinus]|uniref:Uncharacterized protein n=1 Tax=Cichlidogyrus casuarinus TaxID=1844966 RepID=A0ABD2QDY1_9PLAT
MSYLNAMAVTNQSNGAHSASEWSVNSASCSSSVGSGLSSASAPPGVSFLSPTGSTNAGPPTSLPAQRTLAFSQPTLTADSRYGELQHV